MPASKNTSLSNFDLGRECERRAYCHFQDLGYELKYQNHRVGGVEIDLIFKKQHWLFVEVKSINNWDQMPFRLSQKQMRRLMWARDFWLSRWDEPTCLHVAFVSKDRIEVLKIEDLLN